MSAHGRIANGAAPAARKRRWRARVRGWLAPLALAACMVAMLACAATLVSTLAGNRTIAALADGREISVEHATAPMVALAGAQFLLQRDRTDEAQPLVERIAVAGDARIAADALYDIGNARLRHALSLISDNHLDAATADIVLAKDAYLRALRIDPGFWDAKVNLDIAMRLLRDFPDAESSLDEPKRASKRIWADLPGLPKGGP